MTVFWSSSSVGIFKSKYLPASIWNSGVLHLPVPLSDAHRSRLEAQGWMDMYLSGVEEPRVIGGASKEEAEQHFIHRFLNSAARSQLVCADPFDVYSEIRDMVLDQLADGHLFLLDIASGSGAGTLAILSLICELRRAKSIPKFPVNVSILGVDYSPAALLLYQETLSLIAPWLESNGLNVALDLSVCNLKIPGELDEALDFFFDEANKYKVNRFLCVLSAVTGVGKEGLEELHDSLKLAAARLSHKKRTSSWLWIEPHTKKSWPFQFGNAIRLILKKIPFIFAKKGDSYNIKTDVPLIPDPLSHKFEWRDPHKLKNVPSHVMVMAFKGN
jgi:hypothetical protein